MNHYWAHVLRRTGDPDAPLGAILIVDHFDRMGQMVDGATTGIWVILGERTFRLRPGDVELLDSAAAKRLRTQRKHEADRAAPTWRGPGRE